MTTKKGDCARTNREPRSTNMRKLENRLENMTRESKFSSPNMFADTSLRVVVKENADFEAVDFLWITCWTNSLVSRHIRGAARRDMATWSGACH